MGVASRGLLPVEARWIGTSTLTVPSNKEEDQLWLLRKQSWNNK